MMEGAAGVMPTVPQDAGFDGSQWTNHRYQDGFIGAQHRPFGKQ
jgi:hypothetical protein